MILAIETSCDETAVALVRSPLTNHSQELPLAREGELIAELIASQAALHVPYGGVVPELAAREHLQNLPFLINRLFQQTSLPRSAVSAVSVTRGPGLKGCLMVGVEFAKAFAFARRIPLVAINHLEAHLFSPQLLAEDAQPVYPALALLVSGGHTMLVVIKSNRVYEVLATTRDDAAGEAFDKVAQLLGLPYPGGPSLAKRAAVGDRHAYTFPIAMPNDQRWFSFSGVKTAVRLVIEELRRHNELTEQKINDICAAAEFAITKALVEKTITAVNSRAEIQSVILTGGVAANVQLRQSLAKFCQGAKLRFCVPPPKWCTDNAAMVGIAAARIMEHRLEAYKLWTPSSAEGMLGPDLPMGVGALARWPLTELMTV